MKGDVYGDKRLWSIGTKSYRCFSQEGSFTLGRERFRVEVVGKPRPQHGSGEPKTDVYILGVNENGVHKELKISLKLESSNEFQENKVSAERAESFFR